MTYRTIIINLFLFIVYSLVFFGISRFLASTAFSLFIILLVIIFITQPLHAFLNRLIFRRYYFLLSRSSQIIDALNDKLNGAVRYHEITKILYQAFHELFPDTPYAFYIQEANAFYLAHYEYLKEDIELPYAFDRDVLENPSVQTPIKSPDDLHLNQDEAKKLKKAGFRQVFPFYGHNTIFALLFIDTNNKSMINTESTRHLFMKIQKKAGLLLENSGLIIDLERKNYETRKIIELSHRILSSLDTQNILDFILDTLKTIVHYDAAAIFLLDQSGGRLLNTGSRGYDTDVMKNLYLKVGQGACGWVVKTKKIDVVSDIRSARHYIELRKETRSQISIPLIFEDEVLGVLCMESNQVAFFKEDRVDILRLFANQAAIAIYNARQIDVRRAKQAFEHELINAGKVQQGLLVNSMPHVDQLKITALNIPSKIVSGDLYDISKFDETHLGLSIGDISGKGAPAALMMALILAGLRSQNKYHTTTCDLVYRLNELLCQTTIEGKYATFFYAIIDIERAAIIYTNAGHNPPLVFRANGDIVKLKKGGIVLGFIPGQEYLQDEIPFEKGDLLVAYTDGVTETLNSKDEEFGEERLQKLIGKHRSGSVHEIKDMIIRALNRFSNHANPTDDITLILCKHL